MIRRFGHNPLIKIKHNPWIKFRVISPKRLIIVYKETLLLEFLRGNCPLPPAMYGHGDKEWFFIPHMGNIMPVFFRSESETVDSNFQE